MTSTGGETSTDAKGSTTLSSQAPPTAAPEILSLNDLKISLPQDVYDYLAEQYNALNEDCIGRPQKRHCQNNYDGNEQNVQSQTHLDKMLKYLKTPPSDTCCRVNLISSSLDELVHGLTDHLKFQSSEESSGVSTEKISLSDAIQTPAYTVQQHEKIDDLVIIREKASVSGTVDLFNAKVPPKSLLTKHHESSKYLQLSDLKTRREKGWPLTHRAIIVDRFCGEAVLRGANVFVKGILCADTGIWSGEEVAVYADLRGPKSKSLTRGLVLENYSGKCVFLGVGVSCCKRSEYFSQSNGLGVKMIKTAGPSQPSLNGVLVGKMMLQNLPSVVVGRALEPQKGDVILDMCCAPGGKTSHIASLIKNEGFIIACDKSRKKMVSVREFFRSMGASCIVPLALDSTKSLLELKNPESWKSPKDIANAATSSKKDGLLDVKGFYANSFDKIILDPPCSALGLRPKLLIDVQTSKELMKHAEYQRNFVRVAVPLLKPGGSMMYSTCTINAAENEQMVTFILSEFPCMKLVPIAAELPGLPGLSGMGLSDDQRGMVRRFDPSDDGDTMGFFVAKFVKAE